MSEAVSPSPTPAAPPRRRRLWPWLLGGVLALPFVLLAALWGAWRSDAGLDWALSQVPGLEIEGRQGRPDGGAFAARRLHWEGGGTAVTVEDLAWSDLRWQWRPYEGAWLKLELIEPRAQQVSVKTPPPKDDAPPPKPPEQLTLPVEVVVRDLRVGSFTLNDQAPLTDLRADLHAGDEQGRVHRVPRLALQREGLSVQAQASLGTRGDELPLHAQAELRTLADAAWPWQATLKADGTLSRLAVDANLTAEAGAGAQVKATVTPFAPWPLAALRASTRDLDLAALAAGLPATKLSGEAEVDSSGLDQPLRVSLSMRNAEPGLWDAGRLPLRQLQVTLQGRPDDLQTLEFSALDADLGGTRDGGRLTGGGRWQGDTLNVEAALRALRPANLDSRAPAMSLAGPLQLTLRGLPTPGTAAPATPAPLAGTLAAELTGRIEQRRNAPPVRVQAKADFERSPDGTFAAQVAQAQVVAGAARATLTATLRQGSDRVWRIESDGNLAKFDPSVWFPTDNPAWRRGPHVVNAEWKADLAVPPAATPAAPASPLAALRALRGNAAVTLRDSRLAGVALQGNVSMRGDANDTRLQADLRAAGNRVSLDALTAKDSDRLQADVQAPALAALGPVLALVPGAKAWAPQAGTLTLNARADGRWPALRTQGTMRADGVRSEALSIGTADARWSLEGTSVNAPLSLVLIAQDVASGPQRLDRVQANLDGTLADHTLTVQASSPVRPPAWTDPLLGNPPPPRGTTGELRLQGRWQPGRDGAGLWRGTLAQLQARPRSTPSMPWVSARDVTAEVRVEPGGRIAQAAVEPGRIELLGATLRWQQARWQAPARDGQSPRIALDAALEPLPIAPLLKRLQPQFGWGGDLTITGQFRIDSGATFGADIVIERAEGDLTVSDETGTTSFGLTDLRLAMIANEGTWHFTQGVAGSNLGVLGGAQSLRLSPSAVWPPPQTPLEGVMELRVANLGIWAPWLPPGWRLGGQLRTSASFGGRFGAPEYLGEIVGSDLAVRNLLQGVLVRDGELAIQLRGEDARIDKFVFRGGGDGTLRIDGGASFGESPRAQLSLAADRFQLLSRVDRRITVSGSADMGLRAEQLRLNGRFKIDEGLVDVSQADAPSLDSDVVVVNRPGEKPKPDPAEAAPPKPSLLTQADVSLTIQLGDELRLRGRGLDAKLRGELRIGTPQGEVAVTGTVRVEDGTYTAYGQNLAIERGVLNFTGEVGNPRLDILAIRPDIDEVRVGVAVTGRTFNPRVRLVSEPELSEIDKLSWLVMGRASEGLGRADTALLQRAALALLAGESSGGPGQGLLQTIGLDELSLRQTENGEVRDTVITLGKQLSSRWYVGYERGVNAAAGTWQLIYRIARRFTVRAQAGNENAVDLIRTWRWD